MWKKILGGGEPQSPPPSDNQPSAEPVAKPTSQTEITMSDQVQEPKADIGKQQIGTVYAKAFLAAAAKNQTVDSDLEEFGALLASVIEKEPAFEQMLASPRVAIEEKIALLDKTLKGRVSDGLLTFIKVVCQHERLDCLREIYLAARDQHTRGTRRSPGGGHNGRSTRCICKPAC